MEILRSIGVACSGVNGSEYKANSRMRDGRELKRGSEKSQGKVGLVTAVRELRRSSHVFFISAGV